MSTRTGRAPNISIGLIVAIKLYGVVITSSPSPTPAAYKAQWIAAVPLFTAKACFTPQYLAQLSSSSATFGP